jgi:hypothetical protein
MCATKGTVSDSGRECAANASAKQTCVEVPFDYPASHPVVGTL